MYSRFSHARTHASQKVANRYLSGEIESERENLTNISEGKFLLKGLKSIAVGISFETLFRNILATRVKNRQLNIVRYLFWQNQEKDRKYLARRAIVLVKFRAKYAKTRTRT